MLVIKGILSVLVRDLVLHSLMVQRVPAFAYTVEYFFQLVLVYIAVFGKHVVVVFHIHKAVRPECGFAVAVQLSNLAMAQVLSVLDAVHTLAIYFADIYGTVLADTRGFVA